MLTGSVTHNIQNLRYIVASTLEDEKLLKKNKPALKLKHANSILEYFEYFCQMSSKSIVIILSYSVSKLVRFLRHSVLSVMTQRFLKTCKITALSDADNLKRIFGNQHFRRLYGQNQ